MRAAGFSTYPYKLAAFALAGALAGLAGFLYRGQGRLREPRDAAWHESGAVLLMLILGGIGTLRGAVLGAFAFVAAEGVVPVGGDCSARFASIGSCRSA